MTDGLLNTISTGISGPANLAGRKYPDYSANMQASRLRTAVGWLPTVVILAAAASLVPSLAGRQQATHSSYPATIVSATAKPATVGLVRDASLGPKLGAFNPSIVEAIVPEQPAPVDGLKISSQSWRRGGLGSNAFITMTLRNNNEYAVKDIDISCTFLRQDGSRLTERSRMIPEMINMKSRKTFVRLHVGFVNVNAAKAKCSLVAASHV